MPLIIRAKGKQTNQEISVIVSYDEYSSSPREWDNVGTLMLISSYYGGDESIDFRDLKKITGDEFTDLAYKIFGKTAFDDNVIVPVYRYEHGNVSYNTYRICEWDSGLVGLLYASKEKIRQEYGVKRVSKNLEAKVCELLTSELETFSKWASGEVYNVHLMADGEHITGISSVYDIDDKGYFAQIIEDMLDEI